MLNWYFIYKLCLTLPMADLNIRMSDVRLSSVLDVCQSIAAKRLSGYD